MSLFSRDPILLTPGPLTTSLATKSAMLRDWGSWDAAFNAVTADVRRKLVAIVHGEATHVCVPMQGSGTFSVEAAVNTLVPRDGHVLVLINGAYGTRMAKLTKMMGRRLSTFETAEDVPTTPRGRRPAARRRRVDHARRADPLRDVDRDPQSAARDRGGRAAARPAPHRRRDELVRGDRDRRAHDAVRRADRGVGQMRRGPARHGLRPRPPRCARALRRQLVVAGARPARPVGIHGADHAVALHAADARDDRAQRGARPADRGRRTAGAPRALFAELRDAARAGWPSSASGRS